MFLESRSSRIACACVLTAVCRTLTPVLQRAGTRIGRFRPLQTGAAHVAAFSFHRIFPSRSGCRGSVPSGERRRGAEGRAAADGCATAREREVLTSPQAVRDLLRVKLGGLEQEVLAVLMPDAQNRLIEYVELFRSTVSQASMIGSGALILHIASLAVPSELAAVLLPVAQFEPS
jgi:hypothetical protein